MQSTMVFLIRLSSIIIVYRYHYHSSFSEFSFNILFTLFPRTTVADRRIRRIGTCNAAPKRITDKSPWLIIPWLVTRRDYCLFTVCTCVTPVSARIIIFCETKKKKNRETKRGTEIDYNVVAKFYALLLSLLRTLHFRCPFPPRIQSSRSPRSDRRSTSPRNDYICDARLIFFYRLKVHCARYKKSKQRLASIELY